MGNSGSSFQTCINSVCGSRVNCVGIPATNPIISLTWARPYNLDFPVEPIAVVRPKDAHEVSEFVTCAAQNNIRVQALSGGHSYGNFGLGGDSGELVIDLVNLQGFSMDNSSWQATFGSGNKLQDVTQKLHDNGKRAVAHGTCPGVGIGGHATIGGLGPSSRLWGALLDHVVEVEIVTADGKIQRASDVENSDLFFAVKGAGAGFGVVTEFVLLTHPEPSSIQYIWSHSLGNIKDMAPFFAQWQNFISDPDLDRRFGGEFILYELGAMIRASFQGTKAEFEATGIPARFPVSTSNATLNFKTMDWLAAIQQRAKDSALFFSDMSTAFVAKSLAFRKQDLLDNDDIVQLFDYIDAAQKGTPVWFLIVDVTGGAITDVPLAATSYPHRDKIMFAQGYAIGIPVLSQTTRDFVSGIMATIRSLVPNGNELTTYAGYVDPNLPNPQQQYWGSNLPRLMNVKAKWDPKDVFHNPQSVRPAT